MGQRTKENSNLFSSCDGRRNMASISSMTLHDGLVLGSLEVVLAGAVQYFNQVHMNPPSG